MPKPAPATVHLYPTGEWLIPNVPAVECDVTPRRAAELLAYTPPAFTTTPPAAPPDEAAVAATDSEA